MNYDTFLQGKRQLGGDHGFEPTFMPDCLFDFQKALVEWAVRKGRAAIFADCGLGKTLMQLVWAENVVRKTNKPVLILTPLAVSWQTVAEALKFGMEAMRCQDGKVPSGAKIVVTNYERLHYFDKENFTGVVCDESSILKHFSGATQKDVTRFMNKLPYRLLCTATAAPNDYVELGTSSEALGELNHTEMLTRFFRYLDDKGQKKELRDQAFAVKSMKHFARLAFRVHQTIGQWRLKNHAVQSFWQWIASWARACRKPSDFGFADDGFILPPLTQYDHCIMPSTPPEGWLFTAPACGLKEERDERRRTLKQRCEFVASLVQHKEPSVVWCHMNAEGDMLEDMIPGAEQVAGATPDEEKEDIYNAFCSGQLSKLVIKPKIGAWGLNWQHCAHVVTFASHSYEQHYQSLRRCWRFGQKRPVRLDVICTEGERGVLKNLQRKAAQADVMFTALVKEMNNALTVKPKSKEHGTIQLPNWL
jgi:hypothetical protein